MVNKQNLKNIADRTTEEQRKIQVAGGIASGKARAEKKALREILRAALDEDGGNGLTKQQLLVAKALANSYNDPRFGFKDLKDMQDLLGESVTNLNITSPAIIVKDRSDADMVAEIMEGER